MSHFMTRSFENWHRKNFGETVDNLTGMVINTYVHASISVKILKKRTATLLYLPGSLQLIQMRLAQEYNFL